MKITKRQLRRIILEAIDPREMEEPIGGWVGDALKNDPDYYHPDDTDNIPQAVGDLVRSVDFRGDGYGGDYKRVVGDQIGTVIEIDDSEDGPIQFVVNWSGGAPTMVSADELELVTEGNSTDPRGLKALLASLGVKGQEFNLVADALSMSYSDEGGPQDMKDEVEIHSGGLGTSLPLKEWIDWPLETYQEIWNLYKKARQSYKTPQASGPRW